MIQHRTSLNSCRWHHLCRHWCPCTGPPTLTATHAVACETVRANGFEPHAIRKMACDYSAATMASYSYCQNFGLYPVMFQPTAKKRNERTRTRNMIRTRHVLGWGHDVVRYPIRLDADDGSIGYWAHICARSSNPVKSLFGQFKHHIP